MRHGRWLGGSRAGNVGHTATLLRCRSPVASRYREDMRKLLLAGAIALSLTGCSLALAEPPPPEGAELQGYIAEQQRRIPTAEVLSDGEVDFSLNGTSCLEHAQEFLASVDVTSITDEQVVLVSEQFEQEMVNCEAGVIVDPNAGGYFSAAQLDYVYDYFQDSLVPCLQLQGLNVGYAPSRAEFATAAGWIMWDPYSELGAAVPPSRSEEIRSRCPEYPPAGFLGGR